MKKSYFLTIVAMLFCCLGMNAAAELTFSNVSLAPGSALEALAQDQQITFNTNMDAEIGYMRGEVKDETAGEVVLSFITVYDPNFNNTGGSHEATEGAPQTKKDPHFTFVCPSFTKMYEGHTYSLNLTAWESKDASRNDGAALATGSIKYVGSTPAYLGSPFKLVAVTPDPETHVITSADNRSVTLRFNNMVRMNMEGTFVNTGQGTSEAYESVVPGDDAETVVTTDKDGNEISKYVYSKSWTLTPKMSTISDGSDVIFAADAYDKSGLHVSEGTQYSTGADESSYYTFTVANDLGRETFEITPATGETVKNLSSVVVENAQGIDLANIVEPAVLYEVAEDGSKKEVAQVTYTADLEVSEDELTGDKITTSARLMFDKAITKAGNYVLSFPRRYFNIGTGMMAGGTAATDVNYTIEKEATPYTVAFTPSDDETITTLSEVKISFTDENEYGDPKFMLGFEDMEAAKAYVYNAKKELVSTVTFDYPLDINDYSSVVAKLDDEISAPGKYTLVVPDGQFTYGEDNGGMMAKKRAAARGGVTPDEGDDEGDDEEDIEYNALIVKEFTVEAGSVSDVTAKWNVEDNVTLPKIESLQLTFEGATSVTKPGGTLMPFFKTTDVKRGNKVAMTVINGNVVTVYPSDDMSTPAVISPASKANYTLTFPEGYFSVNGNKWPEITLHITVEPTVDSISSVEAANGEAAKTVYTLNGVEVNGKAAKNGAFIVNGKKVILK